MKCFAYLECENLNEIQKDVTNLIKTYTNDYNDFSALKKVGIAWHFLGKENSKEIVKLESVQKWVREIGAYPTEFSIIVTSEKFPTLDPHTDDGPLCKINIPILNNDGFVNNWYNDKGERIATAELNKPIVFNSHISHDAQCRSKSPVYPRLVMPMSIANEKKFIEKYLN
jgi:hypothetical protein